MHHVTAKSINTQHSCFKDTQNYFDHKQDKQVKLTTKEKNARRKTALKKGQF